ncbi:MAG TPA: LysR substrate-binding domain-containing protein [Holophagaceae bacterium]|nr:LysR substrate-binding domain-containing protein [Holophagaceae bacterium]
MLYTHEVARILPPLPALQAFEASARLGSFTRAGQELNLTQGAVSRAVAGLESDLGVPLFDRVRQRIRLTPAGEAYAAKVGPLLAKLEAATLELKASRGEGGLLNLAILPTFGTRWLIPRLSAFTHAHPEVQVAFHTRLYPFDFEAEELDAAIHLGQGQWPGARLDFLFDEEGVVVASPRLAFAGSLDGPADLARHTLLQMATRPQGWEEWLSAQHLTTVEGRRGPRFESHLMVIQAAKADLGFALLPTFLVEEELLKGELVEPFPGTRLRGLRSYWFATPEHAAERPAVRAFRSWLLEEAQGA